ncbi:MAG TPA: GGDEF domain-containing protein [Gammaproteobacteria bacterium]
MQYGAMSQFIEAFRESVHPAPENPNSVQPRLHPVTLSFRHRGMERDYLDAMRRQTAAVVRFGIALALGIYFLFGALDLWTSVDHAAFTWTMRSLVFLLTTLLFGASFTPVFVDYREAFMAPFCLMLGVGVTAILLVVPVTAVDEYYVGYILIIIGAYTVLGLRFFNATLVSIVLLALYLAVEMVFREAASPRILNNTAFLFSTLIIAAVGGYIYERQRRLAHYRLRVIEYERARSEHSALHDPLTGLANRRLFMERLTQALARDKRFCSFAAVLFIDLDAFKAVNDSHGHDFGDRLLKSVAERLSNVVRDTDTVARLGGDEFAVLLEDLSHPEDASMLAGRIVEDFRVPSEIDGVRVPLGVSIGCALHPRDGKTARDLLQAADQAMYRIKRRNEAC